MKPDKNAKLKSDFIQYYSQLPVQKLACDFIGRTEETVIQWKKDDPEFLNQVTTAKSNWALNNSKKVRSKEWLMERVMNDHFGSKIDVTSGGEPIAILGGLSNVSKNNSDSKDS
ncbi:MAG: hypothetical protein NUV65_03065 [Candidatus Roizmanbacteria bacterium]|nr:hypothetical protein [Candidatus Roizmanbacteria bacterium]